MNLRTNYLYHTSEFVSALKKMLSSIFNSVQTESKLSDVQSCDKFISQVVDF